METTSRGALYAAGAYVLWGLLPIYWKALQHVPPLEILAHRMVWSVAFVLVLLAWHRRWRWLPAALGNRRVMATYAATALLLASNWFIYIWAVNAGHVVEASLGYFITPLVNVALGVLVFKERLRPLQGAGMAVAALGVAALTIAYGAFPWVAFTLAGTFGLYTLLRKVSSLDAIEGLALETMIAAVPAAVFLGVIGAQHGGAFGHSTSLTHVLLAVSGVVTALPLLLFAAGARRVPLTLLGMLQYISPTLQFLCGVVLYHEAVDHFRLAAFGLIWGALAIYAWDGLRLRAALPGRVGA